MRRVYLSFLGTGNFKGEYEVTRYKLNGRISSETEFVQVAEIGILGAENFDRFIVVLTQKSKQAHLGSLSRQLRVLGAEPVEPLEIEEDMSPQGQWDWFERILACIEPYDRITIDLTHGFRSVPIVFSTAINFLQKARRVYLEAVYYGVFQKTEQVSDVIDMREFYLINEWAEGVSRLVEDADVRRLAELAVQAPDFQAAELNKPELINAFEELTHTIRNVDIHNVGPQANEAITLVRREMEAASRTGRILLNLVVEKFISVTTEEPLSGNYDRNYFDLQLKIIRMLLEHKLYMQAYTVMREFIGSIGLIAVKKAHFRTGKGRDKRKKADLFIRMLQYDTWDFSENDHQMMEKELLPFYCMLSEHGLISGLQNNVRKLTDYRNNFDHAWTCREKAYADIHETGFLLLNELEAFVETLQKKGIFAS